MPRLHEAEVRAILAVIDSLTPADLDRALAGLDPAARPRVAFLRGLDKLRLILAARLLARREGVQPTR